MKSHPTTDSSRLSRALPKSGLIGRATGADGLTPRRPMKHDHTFNPESLVDQHGDALFRYAMLRIRNIQVAEDLVQETFLAAVRSGGSFGRRSSVRTWLIGILKHKIVDHIKKLNKERHSNDIESMETSTCEPFYKKGDWKCRPAKWTTDPEAHFEQKEFWAMLRRCLSKLPLRLSQTFTLRELNGLSTEEIQKILKVSR